MYKYMADQRLLTRHNYIQEETNVEVTKYIYK